MKAQCAHCGQTHSAEEWNKATEDDFGSKDLHTFEESVLLGIEAIFTCPSCNRENDHPSENFKIIDEVAHDIGAKLTEDQKELVQQDIMNDDRVQEAMSVAAEDSIRSQEENNA